MNFILFSSVHYTITFVSIYSTNVCQFAPDFNDLDLNDKWNTLMTDKKLLVNLVFLLKNLELCNAL